MKINKKQLFTALLLCVVIVVLFVGGCKKSLESESTKVEAPATFMNTAGVGGPAKVLRQSPGLKVEVTGQKIPRISEKPRYPEKLIALLKEQGKKKKAEGITVSDATFSATLSGSTYSASVDFPDITGDREFWLVNTLTWVYTYVSASSTSYASFNIAKPAMYGSYRVWCEGENQQTQFSNEIYLGDPYSGVSLVSGVLTFTDTTAMMTIEDRLDAAMENHLTSFADPLNYMSEDDYNDYADNVGFDEFLPAREFEAYFGHYSLRQKIESEELAWLNSSADPWLDSPNPDAMYTIMNESDRVFRNQYSQVKVNGELFEPTSTTQNPTSETEEEESCPGIGRCDDDQRRHHWKDFSDGKRVHWTVAKGAGAGESGGSNVIRSFFKGKIRCYKKKNSLFSKRRAKMSVRIQGTAYIWGNEVACNTFHHTFDENRPLKLSYHRDKEKTYRRYTYMKGCETYATFTVDGYAPFNIHLRK